MSILVVVGTRPEIIKMAPIIHRCRGLKLDYTLIHTGQHYSYSMDEVFFDELKIPKPDFNLKIGSGSHGNVTGRILIAIEELLMNLKPSIVLVEGDTNSVLASALAAAKFGFDVGHVEAGVRSFDKNMPEEINRIVTDHISEYLFAPTNSSKSNLIKEGIKEEKVFVTGYTVVDAVYQNIKLAEKRETILRNLNLKPKEYFLLTLHRQENVDNERNLKGILKGLELVYSKLKIPVLFPVHPRAMKMIDYHKVKIPNGVHIVTPLSYLDFLQVEMNSKLIITDSGGVQEEACTLRIPCVTVRNNTEIPETIEVGCNILVGSNPTKIVNGVSNMINRIPEWKNPLGNGNTAELIIDILKSVYGL